MSAQQPMKADPISAVAFNQAVAEYANGLKNYAARMLQDSVLAEDVAQDAFLALYRHMHKVPPTATRPWLYRVTRNLCLDHLRRRKFKLRLFRDISKDEDYEHIPEDLRGDRPDEVAQSRESQALIEKAIRALPKKFREAFLLCEVQGLSYENAATILDCPVKTVSTRLFRARQRFRAAVGPELSL